MPISLFAATEVEIVLHTGYVLWTYLGEAVLRETVRPLAIAIGVSLTIWMIVTAVRLFKIEVRF